MKATVFIIASLLLALGSFASDSIIIKKDPRLDVLTARQAAINKKGMLLSRSNKGPGFRVQVVNTKNREEAFTVKAQLLKLFPEHKSYALFQSPYFKVRLGNFTDRAEAERFKKLVAAALSRNVYVVNDVVEISLREDDLLLPE